MTTIYVTTYPYQDQNFPKMENLYCISEGIKALRVDPIDVDCSLQNGKKFIVLKKVQMKT
ncbi:hypothetical protein SOPP22_13310 [Shewanella sp. OPT22]|nr:hypothetical protein SOPP22_13310 [Shewanella sp. OPT22]